MIKIISNLLQRMKIGLNYKKIIRQTYNNYNSDNSDLFTGAKITYYAQSTFHTLD